MENETTPQLDKRPPWRPTDYRPEFCEQVVELGRQGKSYTQIASALDINKSTLYEWKDRYPDFSNALTRARQEAQTWWEDVGQSALFAEKFQPVVYNRAMQCRFPEDYLEKQQVNNQTLDKDGKPTDPVSGNVAVIVAQDSLAAALENIKNGKARGEEVERNLEQQRTSPL